jgi:SET domain-containing protein
MIRVGESPDKGRGVFATRNISGGETIEEAPVVLVPREQVASLDATALGDYYFLWGEDEKDAALLFGLCSLCNHSYEPNARFELRPAWLAIEFIALRDIAAGEEITTNYNGDPESREPVWFPAKP